VPLSLGLLVPQQDKNPIKNRHFRAFTARVGHQDQIDAATAGLECPFGSPAPVVHHFRRSLTAIAAPGPTGQRSVCLPRARLRIHPNNAARSASSATREAPERGGASITPTGLAPILQGIIGGAAACAYG